MMDKTHDVLDSPTGWVNEHIQRYVASDGANGHEWRGAPTLLLTTQGRKTGQWHRTALIYGRDGDHYVLVASRGGNPNHPSWYLNLSANPDVEVQVNAEKFRARAHTASPEEKARLWPIMTKIWPAYNDYQGKTEREIPVVVLEPLGK
jgi:deazaflavin-dependent oxidoreductase (nitroreductase family)